MQVVLPEYSYQKRGGPTGGGTRFKRIDQVDDLVSQPCQDRANARGDRDALKLASTSDPYRKRMQQNELHRIMGSGRFTF